MQKKHLIYKTSLIEYQVWGNGENILLAFHGYGESAESFWIFEPFIAATHTLIAINLPFHGNTKWDVLTDFSPQELLFIIQQINPATTRPFSIIGYSMGGRVALKMYELYPALIKKMILVAPDGLHKNPWQFLATQTNLGNRLFKLCMHYPQPMFLLMELSYKLGFFNKSVYSFVKFYLTEKDARLMLYDRWTCMREFYPSHSAIQSNIRKYNTNIHLIFGKYDKIILTKRGILFQQPVTEYVTITEIDAGHQLLKEKYAAQIAALI